MKQETLEEVAKRLKGKELFKESNDRARKTLSEIKSLPIQKTLEKYSERFNNDESARGNSETWGKRVLTEEDIFNQRDIDAVTDYINKEQQKQHLIDIMQKDEELGLYDEPKQEQERSYSEEEVIAFGEFIFRNSLLTHTIGVNSLFEQFKKK